MNLTNIYPELQKLFRTDKLKVMQFLVTELAQEEEIQLQHDATYSIVTPLNSHEAAQKLGVLLGEDRPKIIEQQ